MMNCPNVTEALDTEGCASMPTTDFINGHAPKRAVLYARVSTDKQAEKGYSLAQQLEALRAWAALEGCAVVEEVKDRGYSGDDLERPGLDRVRDLVEAGGVDLLVSQDGDRIAREPALKWFLKKELAANGCAVRTIERDNDDTPEGQLTDGVLDQLAKYERLKIAERTRRGKLRKAREGKVVAGPKINYGFGWNEARDGYEVDGDQMALVRRVFYMIGVEGRGLRGVTSTFEAEGIPAPGGGRRWSRTWVRNLIDPDQNGDLYKPHTVEEVAALVTPEVAARLQPDKSYGIWYYNRYGLKAQRKVRVPGGYRKLRTKRPRPRSEWIPVPVVDAGIPREWVEAARERMADVYRKRSDAKRYNELRGVLYCGVCGRAMIGHPSKDDYYYYMCSRTPKSSGPDPCPNKRHRAEPLERRVAAFVSGVLKDPRKLIGHIDDQIEHERATLRRGGFDEDMRWWADRLAETEQERDRYNRRYAKGKLSEHELDRYLAELDDQAATVRRELEAVTGRKERIEQLERDRDALTVDGGAADDVEALSPKERRDLYKRLHLKANAYPDGDVAIAFSYGAHLPDGAGMRPGAVLATVPAPEHTEAARVAYEAAQAAFRADYAAGRVDDATYAAHAEEGTLPERYLEAAREGRRRSYSLST